MPALLYNAQSLPPALNAAFPQAAAYVRAFADGRSAELVTNVRTEMLALHLTAADSSAEGGLLLPITVNDGTELPPSAAATGEPNGYVVSPRTTYVHYGYEEARLLPSAPVRGAARIALAAMDGALRLARADAVVILNNWLVSTNLHPQEWTGAERLGAEPDIAEVIQLINARWPHHAVMVRSLNPFCNELLMQNLKRAGFLMVPSRQVYLYDARQGDSSAFADTRNFQWDSRLLETGAYATEHPLRNPDAQIFQRIAQLYGCLYLEKYSRLNPQYQPEWFQRGHEEGWLDLAVLRRRDSTRSHSHDSPDGIDGVVGWFGSDSVFTTPVVGYDTALPQRLGLYRMLIALTLRRALKKRAVLNLSSGAAKFKRLRGGVPEIEYSAVYVRHLPAHRRAVWHGLAALLQNVAVPLLRRNEL